MTEGVAAARPGDQGSGASGLKLVIALAAALGMICIWSGFIVFGRLGVTQHLTATDLTLLRYLVCGGLTLPFVWWWWPRKLKWWQCAAVALTGPGVPYAVLSFWGLTLAPASYGGVFANGMMPLFTIMIGTAFFADRIGPRALTGILLVLAGAALLGLFDAGAVGDRVYLGVLCLMGSGLVLSVYILLVRRWQVTPTQALALVNVPNLLMIIPIWWLAGGSGIAEAPLSFVLFQALFHGLGPGFTALIFYAHIIRTLGSTATAAASAIVPVVATLLAIPVLGEWPSAFQWAGVAIVSLGLVVLVFRRGNRARHRT